MSVDFIRHLIEHAAFLPLKGSRLLLQGITTIQRNLLPVPNNWIIFNTTTNQFERYQAGAWGPFAVNHNLLSATHPDTLAAAVARGDLVVGNAAPLWSRLPVGAAANYLRSTGLDPAWSPILLGDLPAHAPTHEPLGVDPVGDIDILATGVLLSGHDTRHEPGGADEVNDIDILNTGVLASAHQARHLAAGADPFIHGPAEHTDQNRWFFVFPSRGNTTGEMYENIGWGVNFFVDNVLRWVATTFRVPSDFVSLTHIHPIVAGSGTGNVYRRNTVSWAASTENITLNTATGGWGTEAVTINLLTELANISGLLGAIDTNDYVGLKFERDGSNVLDTVNANFQFFGWLIEYVAQQ